MLVVRLQSSRDISDTCLRHHPLKTPTASTHSFKKPHGLGRKGGDQTSAAESGGRFLTTLADRNRLSGKYLWRSPYPLGDVHLNAVIVHVVGEIIH
jgi:hypothetical protein